MGFRGSVFPTCGIRAVTSVTYVVGLNPNAFHWFSTGPDKHPFFILRIFSVFNTKNAQQGILCLKNCQESPLLPVVLPRYLD